MKETRELREKSPPAACQSNF